MRHSIQPTDHFSEFRELLKGIEFLAFITGFLYLSVVMGDLFLALWGGTLTWDTVVLFLLLLTATLSLLFAAAKWDVIGGTVALVCGIGIAFIVYFTAKDNHLTVAFIYSSPFIITGILTLMYEWRGKKLSHNGF